jgi:hypothetical protein
MQELADDQLRVTVPPPPDPAAGWETFVRDRLEWDAQAAAPIEVLFLAYARRTGSPCWPRRRSWPG